MIRQFSVKNQKLRQILIEIIERKQARMIKIAMDRYVDVTLIRRADQSRRIKLKIAAFRSLLSHQKR